MVRKQRNSGSILVTILVLMIFLTSLVFGMLVLANANLVRARSRIMLLQAQYAAESGADAAIAILNGGNTAYAGTGGDVTLLGTGQYRSTYTSSVTTTSNLKERVIIATGKVYAPVSAATPTYTRTIRVTAERTSSTHAASIVSRNIVDIASGVKSLTAREIYANGFIRIQKNTTDLIAEKVTIAGKSPLAGNCSLEGSGSLKKPTSFSDSTQLRVIFKFAYNNCIAPPGNVSSADFDVSVNNTNITKIQSTYIPWSQYMDGSYQNSVSGCSDWTTGGSIRDIPRVGNDRKTHYPDTDSNTSTSCGTNADLDLGNNRYNLQNHAHIRANLCAVQQCTPTFYNPDPTEVKFVFVEGSINFESVKSAPGSGPIAFIAYGADPASKSGDCPYGGSVYIGQSGNGNTDAPKIFFMAMNGLCINKTKFDSSPALGGIAGKNIYVAANPGTPRPLGLDPNFPVTSIPIDLYWKQVTYTRL